LSEVCPNCEAALPEGAEFCPSCGQKRMGLPTMREIFAQFVDDVLSLDSKFLRTYGVLLSRPGKITREYLEGRRQRYVRPLRLYLVNSLVFFLVASWSGTETVVLGPEGSAAEAERRAAIDEVDVAEALRDATFESGVRERLRDAFAEASLDSSWVAALAADDVDDGWFSGAKGVPLIGERLVAQGQRLDRMSGDRLNEELNRSMLQNLPKAIFAMVPVFAGILALVYRRRRRRYAEHFVFALHVHALFFALMTVIAVIEFDPVEYVLLGILLVHGVWSLRTVYAQSWFKTVAKFVLITFTYTLTVSVGVLMAGLVSLLTL